MEGVGSYIDQALVGGILSGVLLLLAAAWLLFAQNALWRVHLRTLSESHFRVLADKHGLERTPVGFKPQIGLSGRVSGQEVGLTLKGGTRGVQVQLEVKSGGAKRVVVTSWESLQSGLDEWISRQICEPEE